MSHSLTLDVPDDVFAELETGAAELGVDVADYCLRRLRNGTHAQAELTPEEVENHPLMKLAGITESTVPDLAARHDFYLAEEMMNTHANEK